MIGVLANNHEKEIVTEFFELFKTPWEFFDKNKTYDVLIVTTKDINAANAKLILIYGAKQNAFDIAEGIETKPSIQSKFLKFEGADLPLYGNLSAITGNGRPLLPIKNIYSHAGLEIKKSDQRIVRIGYSLFDEISFLLSNGQPPQNAHIPTLDLHISILRSWILGAGIPVLEIPPVPAGYKFIVCLTHDIDFIRIRDHKFDHTMWGFLYRATISSLLDVIKSKRNLKELYQNWKAVLMLPLIYLGLCRDFWFKFERYMELEEKVAARSTFFLIPFKNRMGEKVTGKDVKRRAAKYDVMDIQDFVKKLVDKGFEVGVHGIDAWHDTAAACEEKARITDISGKTDVGIRIHWLCFGKDTYQTLEEAGFYYDTTFGYNDAVGYRAGTSQVFKPIGVKNIFELPLNIQDTALFNPKHMSLTKIEAWQLCQDLIEKTSHNSGVLTILWHDRSLSPERLYEDFYIKLLSELKNKKVWFATATDACKWFKIRRTAKFENVKLDGDVIHIKVSNDKNDTLPSMKLRVYQQNINKQTTKYTDLPWQSETNFSVNLFQS
jgi:hypothetical protein